MNTSTTPRSLYGLVAWIHVVLGAALAIQGPALPQIRTSFGLSLVGVSWLFPAMSLGHLLGVLGSSGSAATIRRRVVIVVGTATLTTGFAGIGGAPHWGMALAAGLVLGLGFGCVDVALNAAVGDGILQPQAKARALNVLHAFFSAGTLLGPLLWAWSIERGATWRQAHWLAAILLTTGLLAALGVRFPAASPHPARRPPGWRILLADRYLRWLALMMLLYVGVEVGIAAWLTTYMIELHGASPATSARATAAFWGALLVGRLAAAGLIGRWSARRVLLASMIGAVAALLVAIGTESGSVATAAFALAGFCVAGVFPTVVAEAQARYPLHSGPSTALLIGSASVGWLVLPWLMGMAGELWGLGATMIGAAVTASAMLATGFRALPTSYASGGSPAAGRAGKHLVTSTGRSGSARR